MVEGELWPTSPACATFKALLRWRGLLASLPIT